MCLLLLLLLLLNNQGLGGLATAHVQTNMAT
jgi:hypothetical protein